MQISEMLSGGDPRSLGKTQEIVDLVLSQRRLLDELFSCLFHTDETIRMRAGDALEKICRQKPEWLEPYKIPEIKQASIRWHLAQILSEISLNQSEQLRAVAILNDNLKTSEDWIVTNLTLESLAVFVRQAVLDKDEFIDILKRCQKSRHKSVISRASKLLREFGSA